MTVGDGRGTIDGVGSVAGNERFRVFVPQALGADEFLRATWHPGREIMVFSHWQGAECVAATPVRLADLAELAELVNTATAVPEPMAWPAPRPDTLVVPADGFAVPPAQRVA